MRDENTRLTISIFRQKPRKPFQSSKCDFVRYLLVSTCKQAHILLEPQGPHITPSTGRDSNFHLIVCTCRCMGWKGILTGRNVVMTFKNPNGKQIAFHKALNCLYRPAHMEQMPLYKFYSETKFVNISVNISEARKAGTKYYEYTKSTFFTSPREWCTGQQMQFQSSHGLGLA
jgi:hypothetical protein